MAGKFNLANLIADGKVSNLDTGSRPEITMISPKNINPNKENFFTVEDDITDLAESIQLIGLQQPLVVQDTGCGYVLLAGHRRLKALLYLYSQDPDKWATVPCLVTTPEDADMAQLILIMTNTQARELGWSEKSKAAEAVEKILVERQKAGLELPCKMRTAVAKVIKTSESQLARAKFIKKNLVPEAKKLGRSDDVCYKMAHLPPEQQRELVKHYEKQSWKLDSSAIKQYRENIEQGRPPFEVPKVKAEPKKCYAYPSKKGGYVNCPHEAAMAERAKDKAIPKEERCGASACCAHCKNRLICPTVCERAQKAVEKQKERIEYQLGRRVKALADEKGVDRAEIDAMLKNGTRVNISVRDIECGTYSIGVDILKVLCEALGASADYLLGLPSPAAPDAWHDLSREKPQEGEAVIGIKRASGLVWFAQPLICHDGVLWHPVHDAEGTLIPADGYMLWTKTPDGRW